MLELPVLVKVKLCEAVVPSLTLPKLRLAGLTESVVVEVMPVPLRATVAGELEALLMMESEPETAPAAVGAYCTLKLALWLGAIFKGTLRLPMLKPEPVTVACETVSVALPVLVS